MAGDTLTSDPEAVYRESQTAPWRCDHCGRALDPSHPWVYLAGVRFCSLGCVPQTGRLRLCLPSQHPPLWRPVNPADDATVEALVAERCPPVPVRPLRVLTPEQEAAIQAWRAVPVVLRTRVARDLGIEAANLRRNGVGESAYHRANRLTAPGYDAAAALLEALGGDHAR